MGIDSRGIVSIVELIVYIPALIAAIIVCSRHGFARSSGWIYTVVLCVVRILGGICQLLTYSDHSSGLLQATIIIDSIGISPLLLATLGMLSRLLVIVLLQSHLHAMHRILTEGTPYSVDWIGFRQTPPFSIKQFRVIQLLITLGLILSIVGGTSASPSPSGSFKVQTTSKVGIILYIIAFAAMTLVLLISSGSRTSVPIQERRVPVVVAIAWPFIFTRLVYSAICVFLPSHTFSIIDGSVPVFVCMAVLEEFVVVALYLLLGYNLKKLEPTEQGELASRPWKSGRGRNRGQSRQREGPRHSPQHEMNGQV